MRQQVTPEEIQQTVAHVESLGMKPNVLYGVARTVIAVIGPEREGMKEAFEQAPGVAEVMPILAPYKLASREVRKETSLIKAGSLTVGGKQIGVIAGPCSVENEEQILKAAHGVKAAGATALRGGAFKPRTSPYSFQGLKEAGLILLAKAREATGLSIVTEVLATEDVGMVAEHADVLQIGARNMQNYRLLEAVGKTSRAVLLKRGPCATMEELLLAAEYILDAGNPNVMLCERGIRTFESHTRFTLPLASVAYLQTKTHLPIVIDPSHGTGHTYMVPSMTLAAIAAGCDGLLLEVHHDPAHAASDGYQTLSLTQFADLMTRGRKVADAVGRSM